MGLSGSENFPLNFLLGIEDKMSRPLDNMRRGQDRFFRSAIQGGRGFVAVFDRMSTGLRRFAKEWRGTHGVVGSGILLLRGFGRSLKFGLTEPLKALPGILGTAGKALAGLGIAAVGVGTALIIAAVKYKKFYLDLNEASFLSARQMTQAVAVTERWTAVLGHTREEVKAVVKHGLALGYMAGQSSVELNKFTRTTLYWSKATGLAEHQVGELVYRVGRLYGLGWHGVRQFGLAFKYTADMTAISIEELAGFAGGLADILAALPNQSQGHLIAVSKDLLALTGVLKEFDIDGASLFKGYLQTLRVSSEEGHKMLQMLAGFLGEDSRKLREKFADSPREFVFALSDALKKLQSKSPMVRDMLEREFEQAFGISQWDIRGFQAMTREGLLSTLKKIEDATKAARLEEQVRTKMIEQLTNSWGQLIERITPILAEIGLPLLKKLTEIAPDFLRAAAKWASNDFPRLFRELVDTIGSMIKHVDWRELGLIIQSLGAMVRDIMLKTGLLSENELDPLSAKSRSFAYALGSNPKKLFLGGNPMPLWGMYENALSTDKYGVAVPNDQVQTLAKAAAAMAVLGSGKYSVADAEQAFRADPLVRDNFLQGLRPGLVPHYEVTQMARIHAAEVDPSMTFQQSLRLMLAGRKRLDELFIALSPLDSLSSGASVGGLNQSRMALRKELTTLADQHGLPRQLLESVARRESGFSMDAVSRAGARGIMQLMPDTAAEMKKRLGLTADPLADRGANLAAGAGLLKLLVDKYGGDLALALAAYNWGPGNVSNALKEAGGDREAVLGHIPIETRSYVRDILSDALVTASPAGSDVQLHPASIRHLDDMVRILEQIRDQGAAGVTPGVAPFPTRRDPVQEELLRRAGGR